MQDFTLTTYKKLMQELLTTDYSFQTLQDFIQQPADKAVMLRHDVDRKPENAFAIAKIEKEDGIKACYYFRIVKESYDEDIIRQIAEMGHEIGYHYENISDASKKCKVGAKKTKRGKESKEIRNKEKLFELAIKDFQKNLEKLRKLYAVKTICMHGSPLSGWDNRDLWKSYNYRDFGIIAEPYFDIDFGEVFYLTDTGRRWDGESVSIRDKVDTTSESEVKKRNFKIIKYHSTFDIIKGIRIVSFPEKVMMTTHPQRWTNNPVLWTKELIWQRVKNVGKRLMVNYAWN